MKTFYKKSTKILNDFFNIIAFIFLFSMVVLVFSNAVARYIFNKSLPVSEELSRYAFIWITFLGAVSAFKGGKHVGVSLFVDLFKGKTKIILEILANVIAIIALSVVFYGGIDYMKTVYDSISPASQIPFGLVAISIMISAAMMILLSLPTVYSKFITLIKKGD